MREDFHSDLSQAIIKALLYSDIFHYPLTAEEIFTRLDIPCSNVSAVFLELQQLTSAHLVYRFEEFYSLHNDAALAVRRSAGNKMAKEIMPRALRRSRLIFMFPFVRAVMISGSLSKDFIDKDGDIDFFIVTAPGKVWLTRGLLALFQRLVLFNSHKYFCVNYYISHDRLELDEKNIFTATELITLKPMCGHEYYQKLLESNTWVSDYYPQFKKVVVASNGARSWWPKRLFEGILEPLAHRLDAFVMRKLTLRARRLYGHLMEQPDFEVAFKAAPHVSKNHFSNYQRTITDKFNQRIRSFFEEMVPL
ncbi:MAG TPA: hypothetical protein VK508_13410 [Cyclobacteriaceae bacterium]|nr:hypothetical protein [Cyclobacteriaceae bacterium]